MTTLQELLNGQGYDLKTRTDAEWLVGRRNEIDELLEQAEYMIEKLDDEEDRLAEIEYKKRFPDEDTDKSV